MTFDRPVLEIVGGGVMTALLAWAAVSDLRARRIPNTLVLVLAALGLVYVVLVRQSPSALLGWGGGLVVGFALWIPLHVLGMLGAGDVKLFAAAAAWLGPMGAVRGALLCAVVGGLLSLLFMAWTRTSGATFRRLGSWAVVAASGGSKLPPPAAHATHQLPYGVAMAVGLALAWWLPQLLPLR
jgi:prepilin peptidase CpaA